MGRVQPSIESLPAITDAEKLAAIAAVIEDRSWIPTDVIQNILGAGVLGIEPSHRGFGSRCPPTELHPN